MNGLLRDDRGIALPMALGIMLVLSISLVTVLELSSSSQRSSNLGKADQIAVAAAEAGLNQAEAVLANPLNDPSSASALPTSCATSPTVNAEGGTACYWGSLNTSVSPALWTVTAQSDVRNPTGGAALSHTVTAQFQVAIPITGNEAWNYVFSDAPGCTYYQNNVTVYAPLYTKGDLCLKNGSLALGPQVDVYGAIQLENSGRVGTSPSDASDPAVRTRLGCRNSSSPPNSLPCSDATYEVYRSSFSNATPNLTKPPFDATKRNTANLGPLQSCTTWTGSPPSFTSTGVINLMPNASYTCQAPGGELSWDNDPGDKRLTIEGTIWFDGELVLDNDQNATYAGRATIYLAKKASMKNYTTLCAISGCATSGWDPNANLLLFATAATDVPAFEIQNFAKFQGAIYTVGGFKMQNNAEMHGPVIGNVIDVQNNGLPADWPALTSLPGGAPSNVDDRVVLVPGSWRG
jgi:Tfp pilus assembly protein PilX